MNRVFASKTIAAHLLRGAVGIGAFVAASMLAPAHPALAIAMLPVALVALRGCPMCWTLGLVQMVAARMAGRSTAGLCRDGTCAIKPPVSRAG